MARAGVSRGRCVAQQPEIPVSQCWKGTPSLCKGTRLLALSAAAERPTTSHSQQRGPAPAAHRDPGRWGQGPGVPRTACTCSEPRGSDLTSPVSAAAGLAGLAGTILKSSICLERASRVPTPSRGAMGVGFPGPEDSAKWKAVVPGEPWEPQGRGLAQGPDLPGCRGEKGKGSGHSRGEHRRACPVDSGRTLPGATGPRGPTCPELEARNLGRGRYHLPGHPRLDPPSAAPCGAAGPSLPPIQRSPPKHPRGVPHVPRGPPPAPPKPTRRVRPASARGGARTPRSRSPGADPRPRTPQGAAAAGRAGRPRVHLPTT